MLLLLNSKKVIFMIIQSAHFRGKESIIKKIIVGYILLVYD